MNERGVPEDTEGVGFDVVEEAAKNPCTIVSPPTDDAEATYDAVELPKATAAVVVDDDIDAEGEIEVWWRWLYSSCD